MRTCDARPQVAGAQFHDIRPFAAVQHPFVRVTVRDTFGSDSTYVNSLYFCDVPAAEVHQRASKNASQLVNGPGARNTGVACSEFGFR